MKNSKSFQLILTILIGLIITSCNNKKYLQEGQYLYEGATIEIVSDSNNINKAELKVELNKLLYPDPNFKLLGGRPKLWFYNKVKKPKKDKGFKYWLKYKLGEPPVLLVQTDPIRIEKLMSNRLYNNGFFLNKADYEVDYGNKVATVNYILQVDKGYRFDTLFFPEPISAVESEINEMKKNSLIKKGERYDLEVLKDERNRISSNLRSKGYYYFDPQFLLFEVDSTIGGRDCNVYLKLKENIEPSYLERYRLGKIYVFPDYNLSELDANTAKDTLKIDGYYYLKQDSAFRPKIITDAIYFKPGDIFSKSAHELTVNKLNGLGAFQFASIKYKEDSSQSNTLNVLVHLTPFIKKSIRMELSGITKSNGFTGPGFETSFRNRNAMRGAELFTVKLITGFETQVSNSNQGVNSYELGIETSLDLPRFVLPFGWSSSLSRFTPHTIFKIGFRTLNRIGFFRLNSTDLAISYKWRESYTKIHELIPLNLNYVNLAKSEEEFETILENNPLVRNSFAEQFIIGSIYSYTFDNRLSRKKPGNFYYKGVLDLSGNLAQLLNGGNFNEETNYELLGVQFSQYSRLENTVKYFWDFSENLVWANRMIAGFGIPTGNSTVLPYIKQFFIGGSNSIRAFQPRTLGPGRYVNNDNQNGNIFIDQSGDIKFEINTELRFPISGFFKGAVFMDAGNIWLLNDDPLRPGGQFKFSNILNESAVGYGAGLRIDPNFFVLRLDVGFPLIVPSDQVDRSADGGSPNEVDPFVVNIAIGYPF